MKRKNILSLVISVIMILTITLVSACTKATPTPTPTAIATSIPTSTVTLAVIPKPTPTLSLTPTPTPTPTTTFTSIPTPADTTAPEVSYTDPLYGVTGTSINSAVLAFFSEAMNPATITATTFTLKQGTTPVAGMAALVGLTAVFTPSDSLTSSTKYTATITTGAKDLAGNPLAVNKVWNFTTGAAPDTTAPKVSSTIPFNAATGVANNSAITATFSEVINPLTVTAVTFTLKQGETPVAGTVTYAGTTATFTPTVSLNYDTKYTATITTGDKDLAGNPLAGNFVWQFNTAGSGGGGGGGGSGSGGGGGGGGGGDTTIPTVSSTIPANAASGVAVNSNVTATFSEALNPLTVTTLTFTLKQGTTPVDGTVTYAGVTAIFTPDVDLAASTIYTATITSGAKDLAGNALSVNKVWSFTTGATPDTIAPTVSSTIPLNLATGVAINSNVTATFSEALKAVTVTTATFTLKQGVTPVSGTVTYAGVTATFNPDVVLAVSTVYTATITSGVQDLAGNALAVNKVWSFTTGATPDTTAPTVSSTIPLNLAAGVAINSNVTATFSEALKPLTVTPLTFTLKQGTTPVSGAVTYAGVTATFNPNSDLVPSTNYTATITSGVQDLAGNALAVNKVWSFTTAAAGAALQAPVALGTANTYAILAFNTVTSTGNTKITGDVGISPGQALVGFPPAIISGTVHAGDATAAAAKDSLLAAYNDAAGRLGAAVLPGNLAGLTFTPGLYKNSTSVLITGGNLTLDAQGDAKAVFIFQMGSTLTTDSASQVILAGNAKAANVYWVVGTSATLGTDSIFKGNILAASAITMNTGASIEGRLLAQAAAIDLDSNIIVRPTP